MTRRKTTVLLGVALVAAAAFSFAYLRAHSTETLRGTYQGQSWKLSITRNWSPLCMRFTSTDGAETAACGFDKVERTGGAGGPAGSEVEFGPIPAGAVKVTIRPYSGTGAIDIQVHRFSGVLAHGRYFLAIAPAGTVPGALTYQNASGADVPF